jgi:hypothetical protein
MGTVNLPILSGKKEMLLVIVNLASADEHVLTNSDSGVDVFSWKDELPADLIREAIGRLRIPAIHWIFVGLEPPWKKPRTEGPASAFESDVCDASLPWGIRLHEVFELVARLWTKGGKLKR